MNKTCENWLDSKSVLKLLFPDEKQDDIIKYEDWLTGSTQSNMDSITDMIHYNVRGINSKGKAFNLY